MLPRNSCTKGNFASANIYINKKDAQMKKYLIMSLAMAACSVMVSGCATDGSAGEDTDGSIQEAPASAHVIPEGTAEPVIQESIVQEPFSETEYIGNSDTDSADVTDSADTAYNGILDMFYYKIMGGWDHTEDVSYMFYWDYTSVKDLSDAGYALTDLDGNGVPELLVSTMEAAEKGLIYDLYTFADGVAVHAATSGERYCYYLCADNTVYYWASSGASNSTQIHYSIDPDTGSLHPDEIVAFDQMQDRDNPWFHSTQEDHYDRAEGLDFDRMSHITEAEAQDICAGYQAVAIELTPFDQYTPQEGMPDEIRLKQAFRSAAGSENELYFVCDDFDGNGSMEAFGITGTDDGIDLSDAIIYYAGSDGTVSVIDTFPKIYAYGGMYPGMTRKLTINAGTAEFLMIGGADGQETWLYGVKDGKAYQPEVSGQHADFRKTEDGRFVAQPHEGGEGYYSIVYDYDPASGEFIVAEGES